VDSCRNEYALLAEGFLAFGVFVLRSNRY
jgi:hypothetical protein